MRIVIISNVLHDGRELEVGKEYDSIPDKQANELVEAGAAKVIGQAKVSKPAPRSAVKPENEVKKGKPVKDGNEVKNPEADAEGGDEETGDDGNNGGEVLPDVETIKQMNRGDLEKLAEKMGIEKPGNVDKKDPGNFKNKKALREAILEKVKTDEE